VPNDNTQFAGVSDNPFAIAASADPACRKSARLRLWLFWIDQRETLLASLHVLRIVAGLALRREVARRRILPWSGAFFGGWSSRRLRRMVPDSGFCFRAWALWRVTSDRDGRSALILLEDGIPLPSPHTPHDDIRRLGAGRYSHWRWHVYFSSSDDTDPRRNGRIYKLIRRA